MQLKTLTALSVITLTHALIRFPCSQLVLDRLDPLVEPGKVPTAHLHQIVGGNKFNATMDGQGKFVSQASCTTCQFTDDFSNYWTAIMYFRAKNGTYKRVPQRSIFDGANGGMTVYYMQDPILNRQQTSKVTSFPPGFRMLVGTPDARTREEAAKSQQLTYICLETMGTRTPMIKEFPKTPCKSGIMVNLFFPTCWDGKNVDSANHQSHVSYPNNAGKGPSGTGTCPSSHPVRIPQLMLEIVWDTRQFNDKSLWPEDGSQPFVWSYGDKTGYGNHGDYIFGWKGDSLKTIVDTPCYINCPGPKQSVSQMNKCSQASLVKDQHEGWVQHIPGEGPDKS